MNEINLLETQIIELDDKNLVNHNNSIKALLTQNYEANFNVLKDISSIVESNFVDMIKFACDKSAVILGIVLDEELIGFLWAYERVMLGEKRMHLNHICIDEAYRGQNLGSKLVKELEVVTKHKGINKIELVTSVENTNTVEFYKAKGFINTRVQFEKNIGDENDNN